MKKQTKSSPNKTSLRPKTVDEYVGTISRDARERFEMLRAAVRSAVPRSATETISYGIPAIKDEKVLVWFAAFAKHVSLFPTASVIDDFRDELASYTISKGTIHFPLDEPLPTALIKKIVKTRVAQMKSSPGGKKK